MKNCIYCQAEFEPSKPKQKFCSTKCRVYFNREEICEGGFIYCLRDPLNDNKVFYVGKTIVSLKNRLMGHISESKIKKNKKSEIVKSILDSGNDVIIEQLEFISNNSISETDIILNEREKYWIKSYSELGYIANYHHNEKAEGNLNRVKLKTNPIGVCFNIDHLNHIKVVENLSSTQKVVDFLVDMYIKKSNPSVLLKERGIQILNSIPKVEPQKEVIVKEITPVNPDDLVERFKGIKMFIIEDFSNYPMKNKPTNINELMGWLKAKKIDDQRIREQWLQYSKTKK